MRRPRDYVTHPFILMGIILLTCFPAELVATGQHLGLRRAVVSLVVAAPFVALLFALVTYLDRTKKQLAALAMTDMLTGLANRRSFFEQAQWQRLRRPDGVLFLIDADHFKQINDTYGHAVGDSCLQAIGDHLRGMLREQDLCGRVGGEEFAAFLPGARMSEALAIGERLVRELTVSIDSPGLSVNVTLSIGAADASAATQIEHLMHLADTALYAAKQNGRARIVVWDEGMKMTPEAAA
jgi:diguanylate cyclase (GGDEF)-like protein